MKTIELTKLDYIRINLQSIEWKSSNGRVKVLDMDNNHIANTVGSLIVKKQAQEMLGLVQEKHEGYTSDEWIEIFKNVITFKKKRELLISKTTIRNKLAAMRSQDEIKADLIKQLAEVEALIKNDSDFKLLETL